MLGDDELVEKGGEEKRGDAIKEMKRGESESREFAISLREAEKRWDIRVSHGQASLGTPVAWVFGLVPLFPLFGQFYRLSLLILLFNGVKEYFEFYFMFHIIFPQGCHVLSKT